MYTAAETYGFGPAPQPNNTPVQNPTGQGEPLARTVPRNGAISPTAVLVGLLAIAFGLIHFSFAVKA